MLVAVPDMRKNMGANVTAPEPELPHGCLFAADLPILGSVMGVYMSRIKPSRLTLETVARWQPWPPAQALRRCRRTAFTKDGRYN